jgi:hypothetical protein
LVCVPYVVGEKYDKGKVYLIECTSRLQSSIYRCYTAA